MRRNLILFTIMLLPLSLAAAELELPALFSDGMILQRGQKVPVWGWAEPGVRVAVVFAEEKQATRAGKDGRWQVRLGKLDASENPGTMTVIAGNQVKEIKDVLVGEVWVCSGQSNMDFTLAKLSAKTREPRHQPIADYITNEVASARDPLLRQIVVPRTTSYDGPLDNFQGAWADCRPENNPEFTGTGYFFARELRKELGVPIGLIKCPWGGTRVEPWIPREGYAKSKALKPYFEAERAAIEEQLSKYDTAKAKARYEANLAAWKEKSKTLRAEGKNPGRAPRLQSNPKQINRVPSTLYDGMINPIVPYAIKGAIWYQGESNSKHFSEEYGLRFRTMIEAWRDAWGQDDFPFYYAQLAQFQQPPEAPLADTTGWVRVLDEQRKTLGLKNTGMAVLNDIGEPLDIHPRNKVDVGKRLSLWALANDYGKTLKAHSGPLYDKHKIKRNRVIITFDSVGSGLMVGHKTLLDEAKQSDAPLQRFQICGEDKVWKWAEARITGKDTVQVWHKEIEEPVAVRYAWAANAEGANLYNREGLPASTFRTDDWE
jgi:sialate O-acetylesterase